MKYWVETNFGTGSFSKVARKRGYGTWGTDINSECDCELIGDMLTHEIQDQIFEKLKHKDCLGIWMSPTCTKWTLASGNKNWTQYRQPRNDETVDAIKMMMFCRFLADYCVEHNKVFFIENPKARAVWIMDNQYRKEVWYCQYGFNHAKPTYIWTNLKGWKSKICKKYNSKQIQELEPLHCHHEMARRGSKTGTQGLDGNRDRSVIPPLLFEELFDVYEGGQTKLNKESED